MNKSQVVVGIVIAILIAGGAFWYLNKEAAVVRGEDAVLLQDQPADEEVIVSYARLSKPGYVVVYETNANGDRETVGQSEYLEAGEHRNVVVTRSQARTGNPGSLSAVVVADDGDGSYDAAGDSQELAVSSEAEADASAEVNLTLTDEEIEMLLTGDMSLETETESQVEEPILDLDLMNTTESEESTEAEGMGEIEVTAEQEPTAQ